MCLPCAQWRKSCGEALLVLAVNEKSLISTLPAPPPPARPEELTCDSAKLNGQHLDLALVLGVRARR